MSNIPVTRSSTLEAGSFSNATAQALHGPKAEKLRRKLAAVKTNITETAERQNQLGIANIARNVTSAKAVTVPNTTTAYTRGRF